VCSVECLYKPSVWLDHNFEACILAPQQSVDVKFSFYPREPIKYKDAVTFELNGISRQTVEFAGQGTELQVRAYLHTLFADGTCRLYSCNVMSSSVCRCSCLQCFNIVVGRQEEIRIVKIG